MDRGNRSPNIRVISATNQPVQQMVEKGTFRQDLLYRQIIRNHGGQISVQSKEGEGTTFKVVLPVK